MHDIIVDDNKRNGTLPTIYIQAGSQSWTTDQSRLSNRAQSSTSFEGMPAVPKHVPSSTEESGKRSRPPVLRKPTNLHGTALSNAQEASSNKESISARFALLRTGKNGSEQPTGTRSIEVNSMNDATSSSRSINSALHVETNGFANGSSTGAQSGSRKDFYLNKDLPKVPSPTYSPGRGLSLIHI